MVAQVVFAKDLVRRQIKPIGFAKDSLMIFHSMDLACGCKNGNCKFKDESGDFDWTRDRIEVINIKNDEIRDVSSDELKKIKVEKNSLVLHKFPIKDQDDSLDVVLGSGCKRD